MCTRLHSVHGVQSHFGTLGIDMCTCACACASKLYMTNSIALEKNSTSSAVDKIIDPGLAIHERSGESGRDSRRVPVKIHEIAPNYGRCRDRCRE
jgi:hypothetical protein